jgi:hypothetical protein
VNVEILKSMKTRPDDLLFSSTKTAKFSPYVEWTEFVNSVKYLGVIFDKRMEIAHIGGRSQCLQSIPLILFPIQSERLNSHIKLTLRRALIRPVTA